MDSVTEVTIIFPVSTIFEANNIACELVKVQMAENVTIFPLTQSVKLVADQVIFDERALVVFRTRREQLEEITGFLRMIDGGAIEDMMVMPLL